MQEEVRFSADAVTRDDGGDRLQPAHEDVSVLWTRALSARVRLEKRHVVMDMEAYLAFETQKSIGSDAGYQRTNHSSRSAPLAALD